MSGGGGHRGDSAQLGQIHVQTARPVSVRVSHEQVRDA
jgi:hypothetical protein